MKSILVIEDDPELSKSIEENLLKNGYEVDVCFDGGLGLRFLNKKVYDCVILDINLPGMNGYDVARNFRKVNTHTPILMLTAFSELDDKVEGYSAGTDDYLTKPFYMRELILRIDSLLKRNSNSREAQNKITYGNLLIDFGKKEVYRDDKLINLTPREFQILYKLVTSKGELVSKKELITEIWGKSFDANTNTIEVYVNFLRNKVDKPFGRKSIKTKVGFGYYFDAEE